MNSIIKVSLTRMQRDEIFHKLLIINEEPDLQESYGTNELEVSVLMGIFNDSLKSVAEVEVPSRFCDMICSELQNTIDIAEDNRDFGIKRSMLNAIKKLGGTVDEPSDQ